MMRCSVIMKNLWHHTPWIDEHPKPVARGGKDL